MKRILSRLKVALAMPFLMVRYAFSPAFRRLVRMHESRQKRTEDFVVRKVREIAARGDPKYQAMLDHTQWPEIPKDPCSRTFDGKVTHGEGCKCPPSRLVNRRGHKTIGDIYDAGAWKCENCGRKNAWGTPTCRCRHKR